MDQNQVAREISEADVWINAAASSAERDHAAAATYAQMALTRAIAGLAAAVTYAAEQGGSST